LVTQFRRRWLRGLDYRFTLRVAVGILSLPNDR
jgi:hypothetical protein